MGQADLTQGLLGTGTDILALEAQGDVLPDPLPRQEARILEDDGAGRRNGDVLVVDPIKAGQGAQQGRLAAARTAEQRNEFARRDIEVEAFDNGAVAKGPGEAAQPDRRGHAGDGFV